MATPPGNLSFQIKMYYCKSCQTTLYEHEQYTIYDAFGARCFEGCLACVMNGFTSGYGKVKHALAQRSTSGARALCPICSFRESVELFYVVTRADITRSPILNCCGDCVESELHALNNLIQAHAPSVNDTCQYCKQTYPTIALVEIEPSNRPVGCEKFEGCWDCYTKALLDAKSNAKYATGYAPLALTTQYSTTPIRCEHCANGLGISQGDNSTWDGKLGWLGEYCDDCLEKLVIQPINARVHGAPKAPATPAAAGNGTGGVGLKNLSAGNMQQIQQSLQALFGPPSGAAQQAPSAPKINTAKLAPGTWHMGDSENATDAPAKALLRLAARYVQVCLEGGDWDIIDPSDDVSRDLLVDIRRCLSLPDNHDFTQREK